MPTVTFDDSLGNATVPGTLNTVSLIVNNTNVTNSVVASASKSGGTAYAAVNATGSAIGNAAALTADFIREHCGTEVEVPRAECPAARCANEERGRRSIHL